MSSPIIDILEEVALGLGELKKEVVFVGGAIASLYIVDEGVQRIRPTEDIDCVIEITSRSSYYQLEKKLEDLGFTHSMREGDPICRWKYKSYIVDVMPDDPAILGFSNKWYKYGIRNAEKITLPRGTEIFIFTLPYFIASKIEAFDNRGGDDYRLSADIEDIITVLDGQLDFQKLFEAPDNLKGFLKIKFEKYLKDDLFIESISCHVEPGESNLERSKRILDFFGGYVKTF